MFKLCPFLAVLARSTELSMATVLDVLIVVFQEKWVSHSEYAKILIASCRREDVQRMKHLWQYHIETVAAVLDGATTTSDASNDTVFLESSERSMPSTPTEYKSDSDDDWAAEQERMRALSKLERRHQSEWSMPSTPTEYKFDSEDDWTSEEERKITLCELERGYQRFSANGCRSECWCCMRASKNRRLC